MSTNSGASPYNSQAFFAKCIVGIILSSAIFLLMRSCTIELNRENLIWRQACEKNGMERISSSILYGKDHQTLYTCRDKEGIIHAFPAE